MVDGLGEAAAEIAVEALDVLGDVALDAVPRRKRRGCVAAIVAIIVIAGLVLWLTL